MWEIQPDWKYLKSFYVSIGNTKYQIESDGHSITCNNPSVQINPLPNNSFSIIAKEGQCSFFLPKQILQIHKKNSINCVDVSENGEEILSGDCTGRLFLTYIGTEPVPLPGPTEDFDIEDCIFDRAHKLFFSCGGDFRIYEFSATEYEKTNQLIGHKSSVKHLSVLGDYLFSGSYDSTIIQWDILKKKKVSTYQSGRVNDFCFIKDNTVLVSATENNLSSVDIKTGLPAITPNFGKEGIAFNGICAHDNDIVACTDGGEVAVWDIRKTDVPAGIWSWYDSPINKVRYSNSGNLYSLSNDGTAAIIDIREKRSLALYYIHAYSPVNDIAFNNTTAWIADGEGNLYNYDL